MTYYYSTYTDFFTLILVLISAKNIEIKKTIRILLNINMFLMIIHVVLYIIYSMVDVESLNLIIRNTEKRKIIRYSFFFSHPNIFANYLFWITAIYYYVNYDKLNKYNYITTFLLAIFVFVFPNSRTGCLGLIVMNCLTIYYKKYEKMFDLKKIFIIIVGFCFISMLIIEQPVIAKIDSLLSGRISIGNIMYNNFGISLFGNDITKGTKPTIVNGNVFSRLKIIDSVYYSLLINYGVFAFIIYTYLMIKYLNYINREKLIKENLMMLMLLIYSITESICISPIIGFPMLFLSNTFKEEIWKKK